MDRETRQEESRFSLTRIWARNFKSIRELDLELGPLTVLVGPNASGKSNVLDVLRFIKQALARDLDAAIAARHGIRAVRRSTPQGGSRDVKVGFDTERGNFRIKYEFVLGGRSGRYRVKNERARFEFSDNRKTLEEFEIKEGRLVKPKSRDFGHFETSELAFPILSRILFRFDLEDTEINHELNQTYRDLTRVQDFVRRMQFYRLFPDAMREPRRPENTRLLMEDGSNLASVLRAMARRKSPYLNEIKSGLSHVLPVFNDLIVQQSGGYLIVKLRHKGGDNGNRGSLFDLSQESDGTIRLLGLLTAFYQDMPNSLVGVEEPELTMHPGALSVLADVMVEASNRTQVVATTHSPDLIDRLPIESLRAVEMREGCTEVGPVSATQANAVRQGLFTTGELHSMEGLVPSS